MISKRERPLSSLELLKKEQPLGQRVKQESVLSSTGSVQKIRLSRTITAKTEHSVGRITASSHNEYNIEDELSPSTKRWTLSQDEKLRTSVEVHGEKNWKGRLMNSKFYSTHDVLRNCQVGPWSKSCSMSPAMAQSVTTRSSERSLVVRRRSHFGKFSTWK